MQKSHPMEKEAYSLNFNLFLLGLAIVWAKGQRTMEIWIGPWGSFLKIYIIFMGPDPFVFRLGLDIGRGYLASGFFEISQAGQGLGQNLEILIGPFGYLIRFVEKIHLQPKNNLFLWIFRFGPDGLLFASKFRIVKRDRFHLIIEESLGPFKSLAGIFLNLEWKKEGSAIQEFFVQVGPGGYLLQANLSAKRSMPGKSRIYLSGLIGPGGSLAKLLLGIDFSIRPLRPFFELSVGPGDKIGFLYRNSGNDRWINGLDLAKKSDRALRIIGFDVFALSGREVMVPVLVLEGVSGFLAPPVRGVKLKIFLDGKLKGTTRTDDHGKARYLLEPMPEGEYKISFTRKAREIPRKSGVARLTVFGDKHRVVVLSLEDMLTYGWEGAFGKRNWKDVKVDKEITRLMFELAKTSFLIYLTRLPVEYMAALRRNLFGLSNPKLPRGFLVPGKAGLVYNHEWVLPFPTHEDVEPQVVEWAIKEARYQGAAVLHGVTHLNSDAIMMQNAGLNVLKIPVLEDGRGDMELLAGALKELVTEQTVNNDLAKGRSHVKSKRGADMDDFVHKIFLIESMTGKKPVTYEKLTIKTDAGKIAKEIFNAIDKADGAVCLSTMMLGIDRIGNKITRKLINAADRGIEVRVMVDQWLSEHSETFPNKNIEKLSKSPVKIEVRKLSHGFARVHKKTITIINKGHKGAPDKLVAFVGGMNWVDASFGNFPDNLKQISLENPERDLFSRMEGQGAVELQKDFLKTWEWVSGKKIEEKKRMMLLPPQKEMKNAENDSFSTGKMFVLGNIPGRDHLISDGFLSLISCANRHIRIEQNFPPSKSILEALANALERGVKIDWVFGARKGAGRLLSDKINLNKAAMLFEKGAGINRKNNPVRVHIYPITVHMKAMTIDSEILYYGTANLDQVSVDEDGETMIIVPDPQVTGWFEKNIFIPDFQQGMEVKWDSIKGALIVDGEAENYLDRANRILVDVILPDQIQ